MSIFDWFEKYGTIIQCIFIAGIIYYYIKNKNKQGYDEKVQWLRTAGMSFMVLALVSIIAICIVLYNDPIRREKTIETFFVIYLILFVIVDISIRYKFRRKKLSTAAPSDIDVVIKD